jgi:Protein of unknown function (DUF1349)
VYVHLPPSTAKCVVEAQYLKSIIGALLADLIIQFPDDRHLPPHPFFATTQLAFSPISTMPSWSWDNPPSDISASEGSVSFKTHPKTDYWHTPEITSANGHFYHTKAILPGEYGFHVQSTFRGDWRVTYDQGGLMIRASETQWIKAGVEYVSGVPYLRSSSKRSNGAAQ